MSPSNLLQAQSNIVLALEAIGDLHPDFPVLANCEKLVENILRGDKETIWKALSRMRELYSQIEQSNEMPLHLIDTEPKYSSEKILRMEQSVIGWLKTLRLIKNNATSLLDVEEDIHSGVLLCKLAAVLHKYKKKPRGVNSNPKTSIVALNNIKKAFELFRELPGIDRKFLWNETKVLNGNCTAILELLNCLRKHYKKVSVKYERLTTESDNSFILYRNSTPISKGQYKSEMHNLFKLNETPCTSSTTAISYINSCKHKAITTPNRSAEKPKASYSTLMMLDKGIFDWLESLGFKVSREESLAEKNVNLLRNGVLLAKIVSKLECRNIEGINEHPKSAAQSIHNIRKVLKILKEKELFPAMSIHTDMEIQRGNVDAIIAVSYTHLTLPTICSV
eukprot:TRINITY_DN8360_c0_g2_i1.p1 TRINITY_DN8360_c0_g2~~TRINITY_DN8360_c0_g2_i1.p1  ORF type:complete len:393 (-),score=49.35 TRINITY_DN8360_c0_g2_i1:74-1252(-)